MMRSVRTILLVLLGTALLFSVTAYPEDKSKSATSKKQNIELDPVLKEVNALVAVLDVTVRLNKLTNCLLANSISGLQVEGDKKSPQSSSNPILKEIGVQQEGLCKLFEMAENETMVAFDEIRNHRKLLNQQFVFWIFLSKGNDDEAFSEKQVGLFPSLDSCVKVEEVARDYSIPTRKCREWKDISELFKPA